MAEERNDVENYDRVDPAESTLESMRDDNLASRQDTTDFAVSDGDETSIKPNGDDDQPKEAEHIKGQIEATRNQMGETIDAIQDRLSFSNLSEQVSEHVNNAVETAKDAVYDATIGKAADIMKTFSEEILNTSIVQTAKNNPLPFILIGAGAGLLAYQTYAGKGKGRSRRHEFSRNADGHKDLHIDLKTQPVDSTRGKLGAVSDTVAAAAGTAYDKVSGAVDSAYTGVGDAAGQAYNKAGDLGVAAKEKYEYYVEENPLAVGAVALALGAAVGLSIPASRYEGDLMGQARQDLMGKVQTTASELLDQTKQAGADAVADAVAAVTERAQS